MDNFREMVIAFVIIGIFFVALVGFSMQFEEDNNTNVSLIHNSRVNSSFVEIETNFTEFEDTASSQLNATQSDEITINADSLTISSIWGSITKFFSIIVVVSNLLLNMLFSWGISPVILSGFVIIIIITVIFLAWKTIRAGE